MELDRHKPVKRDADPKDIRCGCGRLLARRIPGGIELRCPRCKERFVVHLTPEDKLGPLAVTRA